jgi:P4 family phage/plasmid primase-like protien
VNLTGLLEALNYNESERVSISVIPPGGEFQTVALVHPHEAQAVVDSYAGYTIYHGVNAISEAVALPARGVAEHITRWAAAVVDIDVKEGGGVDSLPAARALVQSISEMIGTQYTALTRSGYGVHAYWAIEDGGIHDADDLTRVQILQARFKALVRLAGVPAGACPDAVFDLPRVLGTPGGTNLKNPADPRPVVTETGPGAPISLQELEERLDELDIAIPELAASGPDIVLPRGAWGFAPRQHCSYAKKVIDAWATDLPTSGRHPWLGSRARRLVAMHRRGCVTKRQYEQTEAMLIERFTAFCAGGVGGPARAVGAGDLSCFRWSQGITERMTDNTLAVLLADHLHLSEMASTPLELAPVDGVTPAVDPMFDGYDASDDDTGEDAGDGEEVLAPNADDLTDAAASDLVVGAWKGHLMYAPVLKRWLKWTGSKWHITPDDTPVYVAVRATVKAIQAGAHMGVAEWVKGLKSAGGVGGVAGLVRRDPRLHVSEEYLDADGWVLNTPGGIVNLRTGELMPSDPLALCTHETAFTPDLLWDIKPWLDFLDRTFGGDPLLIAYVQRFAGMTAIGEQTVQALALLKGEGANGKNVVTEVIAGVLGSYAKKMPDGYLEEQRGDKHETETARLMGCRMAWASEVSKGGAWDQLKMKSLSGDGELVGRFMRGDFFSFKNRVSLWVLANDLPATRGNAGHSFWRRLKHIPFNHIVPDHEQIQGLSDQLIAKCGPGILAWVIAGALAFQERGLDEPLSVLEATAEYRKSEDALGRYVEESLIVGGGPGCKVSSNMLFIVYRNWCRDHGENEMPERVFQREMKTRFGVEPVRGAGGQRMRSNIQFLPGVNPAEASTEYLR